VTREFELAAFRLTWRRQAAACAVVGVLVGSSVSCERPVAAPAPRTLSLWSGIALRFTQDLIDLLNTSIPDSSVRLQTTRGGVVVVSALQELEGDVGLAQSDVAYIAYRRGIEQHQYPHTSLRGMAVLWVNNLYFLVPRDSPVRTMADLRGRRVGVIPRGTSGEFSIRIVLGAHGMSYKDFVPTFRPHEAVVTGVARGELDAGLVAYPFVTDAMAQANAATPLRLIPVARKVINQLRSEYPFLKRVTVLPRELAGQVREVETVGADWLLVCRADLSEEHVYDLTKAFFAHLPELAARHPEAALINPAEAATTPIPLHPGAARFYREREILP
jgi:uncharacterized protein